MKISFNLPFASRINSIPGGNYTVLAAVGLLAIVTALYLKNKWDNAVLDAFLKKSGLSNKTVDDSYEEVNLRRLFRNIFAATKEAPENRMTSVTILSSAKEGKVFFGPWSIPFKKVTHNGIFIIDDVFVTNIVPKEPSQICCIRDAFFWVEGQNLLNFNGMKLPVGEEIVSFDAAEKGHVAVATKSKVIFGYVREDNTISDRQELEVMKGKVVSVRFVGKMLTMVTTEDEGGQILSYNANSKKFEAIADVEGGAILSAKNFWPFLVIENSQQLRLFSPRTRNWYTPIDKPFEGASLFVLSDGFSFIAPKGGTEIYLCDRWGSVLSKLKVPEKIQDLLFQNNQLYVAGETQGFIWDFNK